MTDPRSDWFDIGDVVTLPATFRRKATRALIDPDTVVCTVQAPDGTQTAPSVVHDSTGVYHAVITPDQAGIWRVRWVGTGDAAAAEPWHFLVREDLLA